MAKASQIMLLWRTTRLAAMRRPESAGLFFCINNSAPMTSKAEKISVYSRKKNGKMIGQNTYWNVFIRSLPGWISLARKKNSRTDRKEVAVDTARALFLAGEAKTFSKPAIAK